MQKRKFKRLMLIVKGITGKWWTIIGKCRVIWQRKLIRYLLLPTGIIGILVIILVVPFTYTPDTSVPFPYLPPPQGNAGDYIETSVKDIATSFLGGYAAPFDAERYKGQSFIFKSVSITTGGPKTRKLATYDQSGKLLGSETDTFLLISLVKFMPQDPLELEKLEVGDVVDIIGVCAGMSTEFPIVVVFKNCQILPAGVAPVPLPGGPAPFTAGY